MARGPLSVYGASSLGEGGMAKVFSGFASFGMAEGGSQRVVELSEERTIAPSSVDANVLRRCDELTAARP